MGHLLNLQQIDEHLHLTSSRALAAAINYPFAVRRSKVPIHLVSCFGSEKYHVIKLFLNVFNGQSEWMTSFSFFDNVNSYQINK